MSPPPSSPRWAEIEALFFGALELPPEQRDGWISQATADSPELASEVQSLLRAHEEAAIEEGGRRVGPYRLERLLGRGGMGEVWLASRADGQFQQQVALKLVRSGLGADILLPRFRQERQLLARLNHPNITRLLDGGISADGRPYLAMEYVEGEPLLDYCEQRHLGTQARLELFRTLCATVEYAHQNLIVHRDIKPDNVLVTRGGSPKLLDFGIAKLTEGEGAAAATTLPLVTPRYASPEQLRGDPVTTASDVYSLGVLLFELLTGSLPYALAGDTMPELVAAITSQEPRRASEAARGTARPIPAGDVDAILAKALEKDPRRRYASVERLSADIGNYLEGLPVMARPLTAAYRIRKYARRHWIGVASTGVVVLALASAAVFSARAARTANQARIRAERVTGFLEEMLSAADPYSWERATWKGSGMKLTDLLPAASERIGKVFAGDPIAQARLHTVLAGAYTRLGDFGAAEPEARAALQLLPALENDSEIKAQVLFVAGYLDFRLSHYAAEEREVRQAVDIMEHTPGMRSVASRRAYYLALQAAVLADVRKKDEAARTAASVQQLLPGLDALQVGWLENSLGLVYLKIGDLERSRTATREAVRRLSSFSKPLPTLADAEERLGLVERALGNPSGALEAFESGLETYARALGPEDPLAIPVRIELAFQRALNGQADEALPELNRCLALARARSNAEDTFRALHELGTTLGLAGRPRAGEPLLREALRLGSGYLSPAGPTMGMCNMELGDCLARQGRWAEALPLYQTAYTNLHTYYGDVYLTREAHARLERCAASLSAPGIHTPSSRTPAIARQR